VIAYSHSTSQYDSKGQRTHVYGRGVAVAERSPEPAEPTKPPVPLTPLPFVISADGKSIVFDMHYRKGVHVAIEAGGRSIDTTHPLALITKVRSDNGRPRALVRVSCPCGFTRHLQTGEWARGRSCQKCSRKRMGRELTGTFMKDDSSVMPLFTPFAGRR